MANQDIFYLIWVCIL